MIEYKNALLSVCGLVHDEHREHNTSQQYYIAGVPVGFVVGGPCAYQDQFRGFDSHVMHARTDLFLHIRLYKVGLQEEREVDSDIRLKSTSSGN
ncbi:MAG: hypothetical protein ABJL35_15015, partial [Parasphingorhabdus sp.]|uniref:hypothetical protein n=1 Tax=Parasphingorhabdus sp. TaxID=2709688 RepID=UPI003297A572